MSKMSELHRELSEHASELGFENLEQALEAGFEPNYTTGRLEKRGYDVADEAYESRRQEVLNRLDGVIEYLKGDKDKDVAGFMIRELEDVEDYVRSA